MCSEKDNAKEERIFSWNCCDGTAEMLKDCFPDDAGYSACFAMMNEGGRTRFRGQKTGDASKEDSRGCCR